MKCKLCNQDLVIGKGELQTELNTTEIQCKHTFYCVNPNCKQFAGSDLNAENATIAETKIQKVGG